MKDHRGAERAILGHSLADATDGSDAGIVRLRAALIGLLANPVTRRSTDRLVGVVVLDELDLPQPASDATVARHRRLARMHGVQLLAPQPTSERAR